MTDTVAHSDRSRLRSIPRLLLTALAHLWSSDVSTAAIDIVAPRPGEHVVDLGAGFGPATGLLAERVSPAGTVTAIDPSRTMRTILRTRTRLKRHPGIEVRDGTAESLALPDGSIDAVVSLNTMHHMDDLTRAAAELSRVVKPGGRIVLIDEDFNDHTHSMHQAGSGHHEATEMIDPDYVVQLLGDAGFTNATARHDTIGSEPAHVITADR